MARRCRDARGRFKRCGGGLSGLGRARKGGGGRKGRCLKWSRGRTKCMKRAKR